MIITNKYYEKFFILFLVLLNLYAYLANYNISGVILGIKAIAVVTFIMLLISMPLKINLSIILSMILLLLFLLIGILFHIFNLVGLSMICFFSFGLKYSSIIRSYLYSLGITFLIMMMLSLLNVIPNVDNSFGFGYKNTTGYFLACLALAFVYLLKNKKWLVNIVLVGSLIIVGIPFNDRTAAFSLILFLIFYNINFDFSCNKIIKYSIILLPFLLTLVAFFLALSLNRISWMSNVDNILSYRLSIWNNIILNNHLSLIPQMISSNFVISSLSIGEYLFHWVKVSGLDGFFAISIYQYGVLVYTIILVCWSIMLYLLLKKPQKNKLIIYFSIIMLVLGFSETIIIIYNLSYLMPLAMNMIANQIEIKGDEK